MLSFDLVTTFNRYFDLFLNQMRISCYGRDMSENEEKYEARHDSTRVSVRQKCFGI